MSTKSVLFYSTIFAVLANVSQVGFATTCVRQIRFLQSASGNLSTSPAQRIVRATVKRHGMQSVVINGFGSTSITVEVSEVMRGEYTHAELSLIVIPDGTTSSKEIIALQFPINSEHLFLLANDEKVQPFPLLSCRESSVEIRGNDIVGGDRHIFSRNLYTQDLQDFLKELKAQASIIP